MSTPDRSVLIESVRAAGWAGGILLAVLALAIPLAHEHVYAASFRSDLEAAADKLVSLQREELVRRERFAPDAAATIAAEDARMAAEARLLDDGRLLIRVMTSADAIRSEWLPAAIYETIVDPEGETTEGQWRVNG